MQEAQPQKELAGYLYGLLGVVLFSLTLPATRAAVASFEPTFVGLGRSVVAALPAIVLLLMTRQAMPPARLLPSFCIVVLGIVIGFPLLTAIAIALPLCCLETRRGSITESYYSNLFNNLCPELKSCC